MTIRKGNKKNKADNGDDDDYDDDIIMVTAVEVPSDDAAGTRNPTASNSNVASSAPTAPEPSPATTTAIAIPTGSAKYEMYSNLGRQPFGLKCEHCGKETITVTQDRIATVTILLAIVLAIIFWPICWLPFCLPSCQETHHFCGHQTCRKRVGLTSACA
eukprot:jgi/Psemu1/249911/estExt_Genewise1Plus.C_90118